MKYSKNIENVFVFILYAYILFMYNLLTNRYTHLYNKLA